MSLQASGIIRVITEPELKEVGDTAVLKFYGGITEGKDKSGNYINNAIDVEVWGKQANTIQEYVGIKGSFMATGTIRQEQWEGKDGKRSKHVFKVNRVELLPRAQADTPTQQPEKASFPSDENKRLHRLVSEIHRSGATANRRSGNHPGQNDQRMDGAA